MIIKKTEKPKQNGQKAPSCIICGKRAGLLVTNPHYPEKHVCLDCLNGLVFNITTVEEELESLANALAKAIDDFQAK